MVISKMIMYALPSVRNRTDRGKWQEGTHTPERLGTFKLVEIDGNHEVMFTCPAKLAEKLDHFAWRAIPAHSSRAYTTIAVDAHIGAKCCT
jgi:hypothetical protein